MNPSRSIAMRIAITLPQDVEHSIPKTPSELINCPPRMIVSTAAMAASGKAVRFASVRFTVRFPTRWLSRSRIAGRELRFGTRSMYMGATISGMLLCVNRNSIYFVLITWAQIEQKKEIFFGTKLRFNNVSCKKSRYKSAGTSV